MRCTEDDYEPLLVGIFSECVKDGCSVVVRDPKVEMIPILIFQGKMVAFAVANDFASKDSPEVIEKMLRNPKMRPITTLRVSVEESYRAKLPPHLREPGKILHVFMGIFIYLGD